MTRRQRYKLVASVEKQWIRCNKQCGYSLLGDRCKGGVNLSVVISLQNKDWLSNRARRATRLAYSRKAQTRILACHWAAKGEAT